MSKGSNIQEFGNLLSREAQRHQKVQTHWVKVEKVDWEDKIMDARSVADEEMYYEVLLGIGSLYKKPKIGSKCLIGVIENKEAITFLMAAEKVEEWQIVSDEEGKSKLTITPEGFVITQDGESLKQVINDYFTEFGKLADELAKVVVSVGVTPNVPVIQQIKQKVLTNIQNRFNSILIE